MNPLRFTVVDPFTRERLSRSFRSYDQAAKARRRLILRAATFGTWLEADVVSVVRSQS